MFNVINKWNIGSSKNKCHYYLFDSCVVRRIFFTSSLFTSSCSHRRLRLYWNVCDGKAFRSQSKGQWFLCYRRYEKYLPSCCTCLSPISKHSYESLDAVVGAEVWFHYGTLASFWKKKTWRVVNKPIRLHQAFLCYNINIVRLRNKLTILLTNRLRISFCSKHIVHFTSTKILKGDVNKWISLFLYVRLLWRLITH